MFLYWANYVVHAAGPCPQALHYRAATCDVVDYYYGRVYYYGTTSVTTVMIVIVIVPRVEVIIVNMVK